MTRPQKPSTHTPSPRSTEPQPDATHYAPARATVEIGVLNETVAFAQDQIAAHAIPPARGEQILAKYQQRIHQLSTFITNQQQHQILHDLETQRHTLMQKYQSQLTAIGQQIRDLKTASQPNDAPTMPDTSALQAASPTSPSLDEQAKPSKQSRFHRLFH